MSYEELTAPDLVKRWKQIVNSHVTIGRDSKLIKNLLDSGITSVQIMNGMYQYKGKGNITIPIFTRIVSDWLEEDEEWAKVELACAVMGKKPTSFYTYLENYDSEFAEFYQQAAKAKEELMEWTDGVLG